jgi:hypothetical protein
MHCFPKDLSVRRQWVCFVRRHRSDFDHETYSSRIWLCSAHFDASCSSRAIYKVLIANTKRFLTRGSVATTDVVENVEDVIAIAIVREVKRPPT